MILDLGEVNASCEVKVNGREAGIVMSPPYTVDISKQAQTGDNKIEVLVYSTLSYHYQTIPTPYRGRRCCRSFSFIGIEIGPHQSSKEPDSRLLRYCFHCPVFFRRCSVDLLEFAVEVGFVGEAGAVHYF